MSKETRNWHIACRGSEGYCVFQDGPINKQLHTLSPVADCTAMPFEISRENAAFIATAWNSCRSVNPGNPLAVAEAMPDLLEACEKALAELEEINERGEFPSLNTMEKLFNTIRKAKPAEPR